MRSHFPSHFNELSLKVTHFEVQSPRSFVYKTSSLSWQCPSMVEKIDRSDGVRFRHLISNLAHYPRIAVIFFSHFQRENARSRVNDEDVFHVLLIQDAIIMGRHPFLVCSPLGRRAVSSADRYSVPDSDCRNSLHSIYVTQSSTSTAGAGD